MILTLSCQFVDSRMGQPTPATSTPAIGGSATTTRQPSATADQSQPSDTATAVVVITFTLTQEAYPGPGTEGPPPTYEPYPGPDDTTTPIVPPDLALTQTALPTPLSTFPLPGTSTILAMTPTSSLTPFGTLTPTHSATPVFVTTPTPTLPAFINLNGLWYGDRKIELKNRYCEETIYHSLRWRIQQDSTYNLLVNDDLSGKLNRHVVTLSGTEYFQGGTLDLYYILTVGPTEHRLSGYFYGRAVLPNVCDRSGNIQLSVPDGWIEVLR
jgi:hypothetical protein